MGTIILYHNKNNKEISLLNSKTLEIECKWTNCDLIFDIIDNLKYQHLIVDKSSNYTDVIARFPSDLVSVFYKMPEKIYKIDDIEWADGNGY